MTLDERAACLAALQTAERAADAHQQAAAAFRALLAGDAGQTGEMVPLAEACRVWGCTKEAGLKRARRGAARKMLGRWFVSRAALTAAADA